LSDEVDVEPGIAPIGEADYDGRRTDDMTQAEIDAAMEAVPANRKRGPFYALTFRNFRLYFIGQIISVAGTWINIVARNWFIWQLTHDARWLGIVNGAGAIPYVLFAMWGGSIADRHSRRAVLVWTQAASMLLSFALALLATNWWIPAQGWHIAVISALTSVVSAFNMPAQQAFVTDMVTEREALGNAIALNSLRFNIARFLGPILAGIVLVKSGMVMCFVLDGLSFLAVIFSLLMMRLPPHVPHHRHISVWEGFRYIRENTNILRIVLLVGFGAVLTWPISTLFPVFAAHFHKGASGYSAMMSANGIGAALGGMMLAALGDRLPRRLMIYGGSALFSIALLLLSIAPLYALALATLFLSGFAMILFGISSNTKVQEDAPDALRGRVMAVYSLVFNGVFPLGGLEIGFLAAHWTAAAAVQLDATLGLVVTLALLAWSQAERRRELHHPLR
jgi:MFS family permease